MKKKLTVPTAALLTLVLAAVVVPAAIAAVNWQITLKPGSAYPKATGQAQYQTQPGQREFQVEVEHIRVLAGKRLNVFVNGTRVGAPKVNSLGVAQMSRNTELGQKVPSISKGSVVAVRTAAGKLVVKGSF